MKITYIGLETYGNKSIPKETYCFTSINVHRGDSVKCYYNPRPTSVARIIRAQAKRYLEAGAK